MKIFKTFKKLHKHLKSLSVPIAVSHTLSPSLIITISHYLTNL